MPERLDLVHADSGRGPRLSAGSRGTDIVPRFAPGGSTLLPKPRT